MNITISYSEKTNKRDGNYLGLNLSDLVYSLNNNLRRRHHASCSAEFRSGHVSIEVTGAGQDVCQPYIDAFRTAMERRHGYKMFVSFA